jgi:hypothetical protein
MAGDVFSTALLAAVVTKLVDLVRKFDKEEEDTRGRKKTWPKWIPLTLSIGFGIVIALVWQVNTLAELGVGTETRLQGWFGQVLTGALVGGFGSGWHEVFDALSSAAKSAKKNAGLPVPGGGSARP